MSNSREEETYSIIFTSLKHPIRRKILRMLYEHSKSFSEMQETFRIESSHLTYHLENLRELIYKTDDGKYKLSTFGEAAVTTMRKVEEAPKNPSLSIKWKSVFAVLMIGLVILTAVSYIQYQSFNKISAENETLTTKYNTLSKKHDTLTSSYQQLDRAFDALTDKYMYYKYTVEVARARIYIRADGSIEPDTAPILSFDNITYTLTDNIVGDIPEQTTAISVERDDIVVDGAGYTVRGTGTGYGIGISHRSKVTLKNVEVTNFNYGIFLVSSSDNTITGNTASNNTDGIVLYSSSNSVLTGNTASNNLYGIILHGSSNSTIAGNTASNNAQGITFGGSSGDIITGNTASNNSIGIELVVGSSNTLSGNNVSNNNYGIKILNSINNTLSGNNVSNNGDGIYIASYSDYPFPGNTVSSDNVLTGNTVSNSNGPGVHFYSSSDNTLFHNNFINNTNQVRSENSTNTWDYGYPSGGNYWSDYEERYPNATEIDGSGIWDTQCIIDENNQDNYPLRARC